MDREDFKEMQNCNASNSSSAPCQRRPSLYRIPLTLHYTPSNSSLLRIHLIFRHSPLILPKRWRNPPHQSPEPPHQRMTNDTGCLIEQPDTPFCLRIGNLWRTWDQLLHF